MPAALDYLFVYDISSAGERARASEILEGAGQRVQESVFLCRLGIKSLRKLTARLEKENFTTGFLLVYTVRNPDRALSIGAVPGPPPEYQAFVR